MRATEITVFGLKEKSQIAFLPFLKVEKSLLRHFATSSYHTNELINHLEVKCGLMERTKHANFYST